MRPVVSHSPFLFVYFMAIVLLMSIALLNLITALMVDVSLAAAAADKDLKKAVLVEKRKKQMIELKNMFGELDEDGSGELSLDELMSSPEDVQESLCDIAGTDDLPGLFDTLDYDGGGTLGIDEFCDGVFKFSSSDKPPEIDRVCKQASAIMFSYREVVQILKNEQPAGDEDQVVPMNDGGTGKRRASQRKQRNPNIERLEARIDRLNARMERLSGDVNEILKAMFKLFNGRQAKMAKTVAVYKMHREGAWKTFVQTETETEC